MRKILAQRAARYSYQYCFKPLRANFGKNMYPVYGVGVLSIGERCQMLCALSACAIQVRTMTMEHAVKALETILSDFYREEPLMVWALTREEAVAGASCIVYRHGCAKRGEIVNGDSDDTYDVFFIDEGYSDFIALADLRIPHPLALSTPALPMECAVYGLDHNYIDGADIVLEEIGHRQLLKICEVCSVVDQPPMVRFSTIDDVDLASIVLENIGPISDDDDGFGDTLYGAAAFEAPAPREPDREDEKTEERREDDWKAWVLPCGSGNNASSDEEIDETVKGLVIVDRLKIIKRRVV